MSNPGSNLAQASSTDVLSLWEVTVHDERDVLWMKMMTDSAAATVVRRLLSSMDKWGASDVFVCVGKPPAARVNGAVVPIEVPATTAEDMAAFVQEILPAVARETLEETGDVDVGFSLDDGRRFRFNFARQRGALSFVARALPTGELLLEDLGLPEHIRSFADLTRGLVLVTGATGSGKSTTIAALVHRINTTRACHIVTIEDPIEFSHESKMSLVTQREVGKNTSSFHRALRASMREDPDIILVGELRDAPTMSLALETAMTGHLVLSTMHTATAIGTIDRIIEMFPHDQQAQVRSTLADVLRGVVNQQLLKRVGGGRIAAFECLVGTGAVSNCIRQAKNHQIATVMTTNKKEGHRMLNQDLQELVHSNAVEPQQALARAADRKDLRARLGLPVD